MGLAAPLAIVVLLGGLLGAYPPPGLFAVIGVAVLASLAASRYVAVLLLVTLSLSAGQVLLARGAALPAGLSGADLTVTGRIIALSDEGRFMRLRLALSACQPLDAGLPDCERLRQIRISWYDAPTLSRGERWTLTVRLRPAAGFANPDTFDYGAWLWREGIDATGYVRASPAPQRLTAATTSVRGWALAYLDSHVDDDLARRWLAALTLGASERLSDADWALLNGSGTTHLVVISGLHVGLVAAFMLMVSRAVARLLAPQRWRMATWPWWSAALAAVGYAWLAGLEPPALRAMLMTLIGLWVASGRHAPGPWQGWWLALAGVVLVDPLAAWRPGLWLSFLAVALLILAWQGRPRPSGLRGWLGALVRSQCLLAPLMAAAVLVAFDRLAPVAPLVNLLAVPLVGSLMVPLGLSGWLLAWAPPLAELCWAVFSGLAHGTHAGLELAVTWLPVWRPEPWQSLPLALGLALLSLLWVLPGLDVPPRWVGSAALAGLGVSMTPAVMPDGQVRVRLYDVGQGQLIELRTARHRLLYDSGPRFASGFSPLATLWPEGQRFDAAIVSHGDRDHAGGVPALVEAHHVERWWAPEGEPLGVGEAPCRAGEGWHWDGVDFRFLWPHAGREGLSSNDRSCVLLVDTGEQRLLITGDVGEQVEARLLPALEGRVDVLVAGHHGSRTSSAIPWVQATRPTHVLFSTGRGNAHGHPHAVVVRRFREIGSCLWNTATDGAMTFWLGGPPATAIVTQRPVPGRADGVGRGCHAVESPRGRRLERRDLPAGR